MKSSDIGVTVRYNDDPDGSPTEHDLAELAALKGRPIDFTDIPPLVMDERWYKPGALVPSENKQQVTLRLDPDVLDFFKQSGRRYQTRINSVLREYMRAHTKS